MSDRRAGGAEPAGTGASGQPDGGAPARQAPGAGAGQRRPPGRTAARVALGLALVVFGFQARAYWPQTSDDAFITFRYARSLAEGRGPYFNPGEHVEGYTNFLLMLLVAGAIGVAGPEAAVPFAKGIGVAAGAAGVVLAFALAAWLARDRPRRWLVAAVAAWLLAVSESFAFCATTGLETTLYAALVALAAWLGLVAWDEGRWRGAGVAFALAALTRPEGALMFALVWSGLAIDLALRRDRPRSLFRLLAWDAGLVTLAVAGQLAFRLVAYDGDWLPNTYYAKLGGSGSLSAWQYVGRGLASSLAGPLGALAAGLGLLRSGGRRRALALLIAAGVGACLPLVTGPDWMPGWRMLVHVLPLLVAVAAWSWARLIAPLPRPWAAPAVALLVASPLVAVAYQSGERSALGVITASRVEGSASGIGPLADWLCETARPGDLVALTDIGAVGFTCPELRILDVTGLTDRHVARSGGGFLAKDYDVGYVFERDPRFVVLLLSAPAGDAAADTLASWSPIEAAIARHPEFARRYRAAGAEPPPGSTWEHAVAARLGAAEVIRYRTPLAQTYVYAVFERTVAADGAGPAAAEPGT